MFFSFAFIFTVKTINYRKLINFDYLTKAIDLINSLTQLISQNSVIKRKSIRWLSVILLLSVDYSCTSNFLEIILWIALFTVSSVTLHDISRSVTSRFARCTRGYARDQLLEDIEERIKLTKDEINNVSLGYQFVILS